MPITQVAGKIALKLLPTILNTVGNVATNIATNKANKKQAEYQYSTAQEQWNLANQYNNPIAQMQRLAEAGLNPNLVYGSNSVTGNTTSPAESYKAVKQEYDAPQMLQQYQDFQLKSAQTDNIKANSENVRLKNITEGLNQSKIALETSKNQLDYDIANELKNYTIAKAISESNIASTSQTLKETELSQKRLDYDTALVRKQILEKDLDYILRGLPKTGSGGFEGDIMRLLWTTAQRLGLIDNNIENYEK